MIGQQVSRAVWAAWAPVARHAAKRYVAGDTLAEAMTVCSRLTASGCGVAVCYWDSGNEPPPEVANQYLQALERLGKAAGNWYVSMKAPALGYSSELAARVLVACRSAGVRAHFDAHGPETADPTFRLIDALRVTGADIGCTLPGRWRRSMRDADWAVASALSVRLVKGQWADPDDPTRDGRLGVLDLVDRLAGRAPLVAVATHDALLARTALERLRAAGTPCELELLYGLPTRPVLDLVRPLAVPVRLYVPYGHAWLPYCLSHLRHNPRLIGRVLHDVVLGRPAPA